MIKPHGHKTVTGTGTVALQNASGIPPTAISIYAVGGIATVLFLNASPIVTRPAGSGLGDSAGAIVIPAGVVMEFDLSGENVNSALVTLTTATSVELVWQI
jgi:hypothetical protein